LYAVLGFSPAMAKEVERKFLVRNSAWLQSVEARIGICQFYLAVTDERSMRVRIKDGEKAQLTLKFGSDLRERDEYEYPIPLEQAHEMMDFALGTIIHKIRHHVRHQGYLYEVDVFSGALDGLVVAELETPDQVLDAMLPDWLGREVTGEQGFSNGALALHGKPEPMLMLRTAFR
jgi:adenylate cyclase